MPEFMDMLDRMLDPVGQALGPEAAKKVLTLRADAAAQARIDELADRCNEGLLSGDERAEYQALIAAANVIALLQAQARDSLSNPSAA